MASDNSFDVVSKVDLAEVKNAVDQATKEINTRFDLKDSKSRIAIEGADAIQLASQDEYKLEAVKEILRQKLVKRGVSLKNLEYEKIEPAAELLRAPEDQAAAGHPVGEGPADRCAGQGDEAEGAGQHPGRHGARSQQGPRHAAADHGQAARRGLRRRRCSSPTTATSS